MDKTEETPSIRLSREYCKIWTDTLSLISSVCEIKGRREGPAQYTDSGPVTLPSNSLDRGGEGVKKKKEGPRR